MNYLIYLIINCFFFIFQEISLDKKSREDCNNLLELLGFVKKENEDDDIDDDVRSKLVYYTQEQIRQKGVRDHHAREEGDDERDEL
jgi:hypothetical protein